MSDNNLISLTWMNRIVERMTQEEAKKIDAALQEYLDNGYPLENLMIKRYWDGSWKVHVITPEERWLDWQSSNHG
jgi:hypothetical protein